MTHRLVPEHQLERGADGREYVRGETEPFTGLVRRHYSNSQPWEERHYRDGLRDGPCNEWDAEGRQRVERHFAQGHRHGARREWYSNGQLGSEEEWADDRCLQAASFAPDGSPTGTVSAGNGTLKLCWEDGTPRSEESYQDGRPNGTATLWHPNGRKQCEVTFVAGKRDGLAREWYEGGSRWTETTYRDGQVVDAKSWHEDGSPR